MEELKIINDDYAGKGANSLDDSPTAQGSTAQQIKDAFDSLVKSLVAVRFNALIDALTETEEASGAELIGSKGIDGVTGDNVHAQLTNLKTQIDEAIIAGLTENSISDAYLADGAGDIKSRFAAHAASLLLHIGDAGTSSGTGAAYTATLSGFDAGTVNFFILTAHANAGANATLNLNGGTARQIVVGGNNILADQMRANGVYLLMWNPATARFHLFSPHTIDNHAHAISSVTGLADALNAKQASVTGAATTILSSNLTTNRALVSNASGKVEASAATAAEVGHLSGVTSGVQAQLNGKENTLSAERKRAIKFSASQPSLAVGDVWLKDLGKV